MAQTSLRHSLRVAAGAAAAAAAGGLGASGLAAPAQPQRRWQHAALCDAVPKAMSTETTKATELALQRVYTQRYGASKSTQLVFGDVHDLFKEVAEKDAPTLGLDLSFASPVELSFWLQQEAALPDEYIATRLFKVMDADNSGSVSHSELVSFCRQLGSGSRWDKIQFVFDACDLNGTGKIKRHDLRDFLQHMIITCHTTMPNYSMISHEYHAAMFRDIDPVTISLVTANRMVHDIFRVADMERNGTIDFTDFAFWFDRGGRSVKALNELFKLFDNLVVQ